MTRLKVFTNGTLQDEQQFFLPSGKKKKGKARYWKAWLLLFTPVTGMGILSFIIRRQWIYGAGSLR